MKDFTHMMTCEFGKYSQCIYVFWLLTGIWPWHDWVVTYCKCNRC